MRRLRFGAFSKGIASIQSTNSYALHNGNVTHFTALFRVSMFLVGGEQIGSYDMVFGMNSAVCSWCLTCRKTCGQGDSLAL
jgi:hypothetical protein